MVENYLLLLMLEGWGAVAGFALGGGGEVGQTRNEMCAGFYAVVEAMIRY